jgi:hypothetical protein
MKLSSVLVVALVAVGSLAASTTFAISPFKKAFDAKYVKDSGDADFQAAFKKGGCYNCHVKGEKKDVLNAYGLELSKLIEGNAKDRLDAAKEGGGLDAKKAEEEKLVKEVQAAFTKAEALKSPSGKTWGELFKAHSLPTPEGAKSIRE